MRNNIRNARNAYAARCGGCTQEDAARMFGVSLSTYQKWEQGQGRLNGEVLGEVADRYGTSVEYLLMRIPDPSPSGKLPDDAEELVELYAGLSDEGRQQLVIFARGLAQTFPRRP